MVVTGVADRTFETIDDFFPPVNLSVGLFLMMCLWLFLMICF